MLPGFSAPEAKHLLPFFSSCAAAVSDVDLSDMDLSHGIVAVVFPLDRYTLSFFGAVPGVQCR